MHDACESFPPSKTYRLWKVTNILIQHDRVQQQFSSCDMKCKVYKPLDFWCRRAQVEMPTPTLHCSHSLEEQTCNLQHKNNQVINTRLVHMQHLCLKVLYLWTICEPRYDYSPPAPSSTWASVWLQSPRSQFNLSLHYHLFLLTLWHKYI